MGVLAVIWGILSLVGLAIFFIPCLGWLNWLNIPFAAAGLLISIVAAGKPESSGGGRAGAIMCTIAIVLGVLRLFWGGGII